MSKSLESIVEISLRLTDYVLSGVLAFVVLKSSREEVIKDRFIWGEKQAIFALVVRVYQLPAPLEIPMLPKYGGCRSWVELEPEMPTDGLTPVVDDKVFSRQLEAFHTAIQR